MRCLNKAMALTIEFQEKRWKGTFSDVGVRVKTLNTVEISIPNRISRASPFRLVLPCVDCP